MTKSELKQLYIDCSAKGDYSNFLKPFLVFRGHKPERIDDFFTRASQPMSREDSINVHSWVNSLVQEAKIELEINTLFNKQNQPIKLL